MKVATLEAQVSVIKSEPPVRLAHFSPYPPGWRRMIAVYLYIFKTNTRACAWGPTRARSAPADGLTKYLTNTELFSIQDFTDAPFNCMETLIRTHSVISRNPSAQLY